MSDFLLSFYVIKFSPMIELPAKNIPSMYLQKNVLWYFIVTISIFNVMSSASMHYFHCYRVA